MNRPGWLVPSEWVRCSDPRGNSRSRLMLVRSSADDVLYVSAAGKVYKVYREGVGGGEWWKLMPQVSE